MVDIYSLMERAVSLRINKYLNIKFLIKYIKSIKYIFPGIITKQQIEEALFSKNYFFSH